MARVFAKKKWFNNTLVPNYMNKDKKNMEVKRLWTLVVTHPGKLIGLLVGTLYKIRRAIDGLKPQSTNTKWNS